MKYAIIRQEYDEGCDDIILPIVVAIYDDFCACRKRVIAEAHDILEEYTKNRSEYVGQVVCDSLRESGEGCNILSQNGTYLDCAIWVQEVQDH